MTPYDKAHVCEIVRGHGDWFTAHLLRLCAKADSGNLEKIRTGFPEVVEAYEEWRSG